MDLATILKSPPVRRAAMAAIAGASLILQGCVVGPKYVKPVAQTPTAYKEAGQTGVDGTLWTPANPQDAALRGNWWEVYQEPELNAFEEELNKSNQNIAQSFQNFMAARAQVRGARSNYAPTATTSPAYTRAGTSATLTHQVQGAGNVDGSEFNLPFDVSWQPDLWGRIRNTVRQYANAAQVSAADLANERLTEQANLAIYYFELRGQDGQLALYEQTVKEYRQALELTRVLRETNIDSDQDVAQAELNLKTAQAAATNLGIARAQYEHAIALLVGQPASTFSVPVRSLATAVPAIPVGLPSDLLQRRPDISAAERTMSEANALIGVQVAAFYPSLSIGLSGGFQGSTIANWFTWPSRFFSLGPSAAQTLFDAGARKATKDQYTAQYEADVAAYRQTVLTAFQQTEDYLASLRILAQQLQQQQEVVDAAQHYLDLANVRYRLGIDPYLDVYTAEITLLNDQRSAITLRIQQMTSSVQLIEALGGGWDTGQLPSEKSVSQK